LSFDKKANKPARVMARIAVVSIATSLAVMIVATSVMSGFKIQLREKISGFNAHLRISNCDSNYSFETTPIRCDYGFYDSIALLPEVAHIQPYAHKGGIIKTNSEIQGVALKGVSAGFDWSFFKQYLTDGEIFTLNDTATSNSVLISETLAKLLNLKTGDAFDMYIVQEPVRVRRFTISGLYNTYFDKMDKMFIIGDIRHIRQLNKWDANLVTGMEIMLRNFDDIDNVSQKIEDIAGYLTFDDGSMLRLTSLKDDFTEIFNWLEILDMNVLIILIIMITVAGFNMISGLLIMLLEKIPMIGILKSLGMTTANVRNIFIYRSSVIVCRGLLWGNLTGLLLCLLQQHFGIIALDPGNYFFTTAPVSINWLTVVLLNAAAFVFITLIQIIPATLISKITPDKTIRYS
jgi:lipoprotein-releasing system permease protein